MKHKISESYIKRLANIVIKEDNDRAHRFISHVAKELIDRVEFTYRPITDFLNLVHATKKYRDNVWEWRDGYKMIVLFDGKDVRYFDYERQWPPEMTKSLDQFAVPKEMMNELIREYERLFSDKWKKYEKDVMEKLPVHPEPELRDKIVNNLRKLNRWIK